MTTLAYPSTRQSDHFDDYHGTRVADAYRWLEDTDADETRSWIESQNHLTFSFLEAIPQREPIRERLTALWNYERFGLPLVRGGRYFYTKNDGLQNQAVLYWAAARDAQPQLLLDPNALSEDGTVSLAGWDVSEDGRMLAYGLSSAGSDWQEWRVREVETGRDLEDRLKWVKFSRASWTHDGEGFFYSRYAEPAEGTQLTGSNYFQKLYYHRLGMPQDQDRLVYERPDEKEWGFDGGVTDDGRWLVISVWRGSEPKNQVFYADLTDPAWHVVELIPGFEARYDFVGNDGGLFWLVTDFDAPRGRLIAVDQAAPDQAKWREVIPQAPDVLEHVGLVGERFLASYLHDAHSVVRIHDLAGQSLGEVPLAGLGTVAGFAGRREETETFYSFTSFTTPAEIYRYDVPAGKSEVFRKPQVAFDPADYDTEQVFYTSRDGTRVPMFLVYKRGLLRTGQNPTYLFGYGGFEISMTPAFSPGRLAWLEMGGLFALPNLRGGGEYGREWHEQGMQEKKQNVFDDFVSAAEWLIDHGYTSREKLAIGGRSNGGLLVGACLTQRPDLFAAAVPAVGVMDMLRYHKFTIGWAWTAEFGSSDDPRGFKNLYKYSPLHNIRPGTQYPATLVLTGDHDDRVVPAHSFKFAAALQAAQSGPAPALIRIETSAGHGGGTPTAKAIEELTDTYAFLVKALGMPKR